jgi:hypothetical protein
MRLHLNRSGLARKWLENGNEAKGRNLSASFCENKRPACHWPVGLEKLQRINAC